MFFRSAGARRSWRTPGAGELIDVNFRAPDDELGSARSLASGSVWRARSSCSTGTV